MPFGFQTFVVSGTRDDTEGASKLIQDMSTFMVSLGWTVTDDRSDQAGTAHKVVLESNGEGNNFPTFFMIVHSGSSTSASTGQDTVNVLPATAYDVAAHAVPSSGVQVPAASNTSPIDVDSNGNTNIWISGDSEGIVVVSQRSSSSSYDSLYFGRANSVRSVAENSYPLYTAGVNGIAIDVTPGVVEGIGGQPPEVFTGSGDILAIGYLFNTEQPYNIGAATSIYFAAPIFIWYNDTTGGPGPSNQRRGAMGTARNAWIGAGSNQSMLQASKLIASGTFGKQVYQAFTATSESLIMRIE